MDNKRILIIGLGLIGGSYAMGLTKAGYEVYAINRSPKPIEYAKEHKYITYGTTEINKDFVSSFDYIIMGLYPEAMLEWIRKYKDYFKKGVLITDVCGVKQIFIDEVQSLIDGEFIGAHPMAGKEKSGIENADDRIFKNANYIITPTILNTPKGIEYAKSIGKALNFKNIAILNPKDHDEMIAYLSQLTHCIAISLMTSRNTDHFINYTGDSFRDLTRIANINENMWCELFLENKEALIKQIDNFINELSKLRNAINDNNEDKIKEMMILSTERRKKFDK